MSAHATCGTACNVTIPAVSDLAKPPVAESEEGSGSTAAATPGGVPPPVGPSASATWWRWRSDSLLRIVLELVLIGGGVFLGLAGEQWRQNAQNRDAAEASLRRIRAEVLSNRSAVAAVRDYHATTLKTLQAYLTEPAGQRRPADLHLQGIRSVFF